MPLLEVNYKIYDDIIEIEPKEGMLDNSIYEIRIKNVRDQLEQKIPLDQIETKITTELKPSYSTIEAVRTIIERDEISDHDILYYIRDASQFVEYASGEEYTDEVPFHVRQYVKYRAAYDSLLKLYMSKAADAGRSGTISEISFDHSGRFPDIKDLLESLQQEIERWEVHVRGFGFQGRIAPQAGIKGSGFYDTYIFNYNRKMVDERSRKHAMDRRRYR